MIALVWLTEPGWEATVEAARSLLPADAEVTLLYVSPADVEELAQGARAGLLGRRPPKPKPPHPPPRAISAEEAEALLADAAARLGRPARRLHRTGRVEHEVVDAARGADLLLIARGGPPTRFVQDHATCAILLAQRE